MRSVPHYLDWNRRPIARKINPAVPRDLTLLSVFPVLPLLRYQVLSDYNLFDETYSSGH